MVFNIHLHQVIPYLSPPLSIRLSQCLKRFITARFRQQKLTRFQKLSINWLTNEWFVQLSALKLSQVALTFFYEAVCPAEESKGERNKRTANSPRLSASLFSCFEIPPIHGYLCRTLSKWA